MKRHDQSVVDLANPEWTIEASGLEGKVQLKMSPQVVKPVESLETQAQHKS
jgi:hypothetical protein